MDEEKQAAEEQPAPTAPEEKRPPEEEKPASPQKTLGKVLLIEDDLPMVKMYNTKLEKENFETQVAYTGEEGLEKIKEWSPDLVVLDLMIPKIGGMEVLEKLRADPKTKNLPVMVLSNLSQERDITRSRELGVKDYIIKANYTPSQVVEIIKGYLKK